MKQMLLRFGQWRFVVDTQATAIYSQQEAQGHCLCGYCRNFYQGVDIYYPNLRPFLQRFGVNAEAPDELIPYEPTDYDGLYAVSGTIETAGELPICVDGLQVTAEDAQQAKVNTGLKSPCFVLKVQGIHIPWLLDEPEEQVVSPANEPSFIRKIVERFLKT